MVAWKVTIERITIDRDCGDESCNCDNHRKSSIWTMYPRSFVIDTDTGLSYEIKDGDLVTVLPAPKGK